jgi:hypothetical protein
MTLRRERAIRYASSRIEEDSIPVPLARIIYSTRGTSLLLRQDLRPRVRRPPYIDPPITP